MSLNMNDLFVENEERKVEMNRRKQAMRQEAISVNKGGNNSDVRSKKREPVYVPEEIVAPTHNRLVRDEGKIPGIENIVFYQSGKVLKPEDAYKNMGFGTFIATLFRLYHDEVGYDNADLNMFSTVTQEAIRLYGPDVKISDNVVAAASYHMMVNEIPPYQALRAARSSIKDNAPRSVYADLIVSGDVGMTVDTTTGMVTVADDVGLGTRATKCMGPLFQAKESPREEIASVVCELTDTNLNFVDELEDEVNRWVTENSIPDIRETNPFRGLTDVPGLLSEKPVAPGNQGYFQNVFKLLKSIEKDKPDVMIIPGYNQALTGSYTSLGDCSRCIPLPDDLMHASPVLASINVSDFDQVLVGLRNAEKQVELDDELRHNTNVNARSVYHDQFHDEYDKYRNEPHGTTTTKVRYVTLRKSKPTTAQELVVMTQDGVCDTFPVMMRAGEYHLATLKGITGSSFLITDPVSMLGVYFSRNYVKEFIDPRYVNDKGKIKSVTGFYSIKDFSTSAVNNYSSWIQRYLLAKLVDVLFPAKGLGTKLLKGYLSMTSGGKGGKSVDIAKTILKELISCYGKINPSPDTVLVLTPSYSIKKAMKHTSMMIESKPLEKLVREAQIEGGIKRVGFDDDDGPGEGQQDANDWSFFESGEAFDLDDSDNMEDLSVVPLSEEKT
jgi:hypothetical protein